jgi:hypothetical protein
MLPLNGMSTLRGFLFTDRNTFYGFTNSHSTLLIVHNLTDYEIMLNRNMNSQDKRGVGGAMNDHFLTTYE